MYIVAIAWIYVTVLMAATEETVLAGISTFFFYGLLPCSIVMYLMGAPSRNRAIKAREKEEHEKWMAEQATIEQATKQTPEILKKEQAD